MPESVLLPRQKELLSTTTSTLLWSALVIYLTWQISFWWKRRNLYVKSWKYPGPLNLPIVGAGYKFCVGAEELYDVIVRLQEQYKQGFKIWFGPRLIYILARPKHIEKVLTSPKCLAKDYLYKHIRDVTGDGLIVSPVSTWKVHRKAIAPSFNQKVLDSFVEIFAEKSLIFSNVLEKYTGEELDIFSMISRCTLGIVLETAMGIKMDIQTKNPGITKDLDRIMELVFIKIFKIWNHIDVIWKFSSNGRELETLKKGFNELIDNVIKEKMNLRIRRKSSLTAQLDEGKTQKAFLDWVMDTTDFTPEELRAEISVFIFAGTDTTAATLSFLFSVLGIYPDVQQKVYEEVVEIMGPDRQPQPSDLPLMKYTEKVIKETLRLFPVGAFFLRGVDEDLDLGDIVLPQGASVYFGTVFLHRNPEVWEDPLKFDPERFSPENIEKIPPGAYIPFSLGVRNCIGMKYAFMSMKTIIANVVRRVKFRSEHKTVGDVEIKTNIVLRYKNNTKLYVEKRHTLAS